MRIQGRNYSEFSWEDVERYVLHLAGTDLSPAICYQLIRKAMGYEV